MICNYCVTENVDDGVFCQECGKPLGEWEDKSFTINGPLFMTPIGAPLISDGIRLRPIHGDNKFKK
jgi:hypothetical protein